MGVVDDIFNVNVLEHPAYAVSVSYVIIMSLVNAAPGYTDTKNDEVELQSVTNIVYSFAAEYMCADVLNELIDPSPQFIYVGCADDEKDAVKTVSNA
jgi:hypothetical protein